MIYTVVEAVVIYVSHTSTRSTHPLFKVGLGSDELVSVLLNTDVSCVSEFSCIGAVFFFLVFER